MSFQLQQSIPVDMGSHLSMRTISKHLTQMLLETQRQINACGYSQVSATDFTSVTKMTALRDQLKQDQNACQRMRVLGRIGKFLKLHRLMEAALTECYETLIAYCTQLRMQMMDKDAAVVALANEIVLDGGFKRVEELAIKALACGWPHPKVSALIAHCSQMHMLGNRGLIFVGNKLLGETLADKLHYFGMPTATLMGAHGKNRKAHAQASQRLLNGEAEFLVCTSVAEADYFSELEVPCIICYTPPRTVASKEAREKHASPDALTYISTLVASDSPDGSFWLLKRAARQGLKLVKPVQSNLDLTA